MAVTIALDGLADTILNGLDWDPMCSATAVVYSDGVKGVSATGVVPRNWRANESVPFAMKAMRLISSMERFWARSVRIKCFRSCRSSWMAL